LNFEIQNFVCRQGKKADDPDQAGGQALQEKGLKAKEQTDCVECLGPKSCSASAGPSTAWVLVSLQIEAADLGAASFEGGREDENRPRKASNADRGIV